ncbi:glutathione synthase [Alteromonas ponticola]|uniref:Glutathione synthetase n=1 Tax=Alteromonas aquimaris TaxID=2998417 RepID=A0ABT3P4I3_9ALTE|nr:glutathione synthase [Alteromonas aquimaris]MCW8107026.1 glutathione synthase [Alteromonas aquimaris]
MSYSVGIVMDPIASIKPHKDTSFAMMLEAQRRGVTLYYFEVGDLYLDNGTPKGFARKVTVTDRATDFYTLSEGEHLQLADIDVFLMRKDPPFDSEYLYATQILTLVEEAGSLVVNKPSSLRDFNEKLFTAWFPDLIPATLVTRNAALIRKFHQQHKDIICKPLDGMGGASIFRVKEDGNNLGVVIETLTRLNQRFMMVQEYLPQISEGDKRILIVDGEVMPYALARLPSQGETRGNLAAGGTGRPQPLSASDLALAQKIAPVVKEKGLLFVGIDVIGNKVTEINVTSPTCVREIEAHFDINITGKLFDAIERRIVHS